MALVVEQRHEEAFACEVLRRALGATITAIDDNTAPRQVDALFTLPNDVEGALEVTTIGEQRALAVESFAARTDWTVEGARWAWMIHVAGTVWMPDLETHLPELVLTCERYGAMSPKALPRMLRRSPAFQWLAANRVTMHGFPETNRPGAIDVLPEGGGGAVFEHLDELPAWLEHMLARPEMTAKLDKLRATGRPELHLFVRIHDSGMPFELLNPLAWKDVVPTVPLNAPDGLTGLWLAPRWRNPILRWGTDIGWRREDVLD